MDNFINAIKLITILFFWILQYLMETWLEH